MESLHMFLIHLIAHKSLHALNTRIIPYVLLNAIATPNFCRFFKMLCIENARTRQCMCFSQWKNNRPRARRCVVAYVLSLVAYNVLLCVTYTHEPLACMHNVYKINSLP